MFLGFPVKGSYQLLKNLITLLIFLKLLSLKTMCDLAIADIVNHINSHADFYAVLYTDTDIYSINAIVCGSHTHDILPYQEVNAQRLIVKRDYAFAVCNCTRY